MGWIQNTVTAAVSLVRPPTAELGAPGTRVSGGRLQTGEYVPELQGPRMFDVFERMRNDAMIEGVLEAMKMPILAAEWDVEAGSDGATASGQKIAEHLAWNLFEGMSMSWSDHLRQVLTLLDFGFYVCEALWRDVRKDDGAHFWEIQKLAPRLQRTIEKWEMAPDGGLKHIEQRIWTDGGGSRVAQIPITQLLIFTRKKEGANWTGKSVLRTAYRDWFLKDHKLRFQAIQAERHATGIPTMELPPGKDDPKNIDRAEKILMDVRTHERAFVVVPHGYKFSIVGMSEGRLLDLIPQLHYHDYQIAVSVLAAHLTLVSGGSNALSTDHSSFFLLAEKAIADHVIDVHNRYLIPQWVRFNYGHVERLPKLRVGRIETRDLEKLWNALATAAGQMLITPDDSLEDAMRKAIGLPPRDPATARPREKAAPPPQPQPEGQPPGTKPPPTPAGELEEEED